jgi:hypothetical protein
MDVGLTADFRFDAVYANGLHDSGTVKLVHAFQDRG